jgi:hypothetical protein
MRDSRLLKFIPDLSPANRWLHPLILNLKSEIKHACYSYNC